MWLPWWQMVKRYITHSDFYLLTSTPVWQRSDYQIPQASISFWICESLSD